MGKHTKEAWTYSDDMKLTQLYNEGKSYKFLAESFDRSESAISSRVSKIREYGFIEETNHNRADFTKTSLAEMRDAVKRFDKISSIPFDWKVDWAERNNKNYIQIGRELSKMYEKVRK